MFTKTIILSFEYFGDRPGTVPRQSNVGGELLSIITQQKYIYIFTKDNFFFKKKHFCYLLLLLLVSRALCNRAARTAASCRNLRNVFT